MAANDKKIRITAILPNQLYKAFHSKTAEEGATHTGVIRKLIRSYVGDRKVRKSEERSD